MGAESNLPDVSTGRRQGDFFPFLPKAALLVLVILMVMGMTGAGLAHLDENLIGAPPSEPAEWAYHGISTEEARQWIREGIIFAAWAAQWRGEGFSAEAAGRWHQIANVYTAGEFLRNGFAPEEAEEWLRQGVKSGQRAGEYRTAGLAAEEARSFWQQGLYPEEARAWREAGFDAEAMLAWRYGPRISDYYFTKGTPFSRAVYDLAFARGWRDGGFTAQEAQQAGAYRIELAEAQAWREAEFPFAEMVWWRDSGFSLAEAITGRAAGLDGRSAERVGNGESAAPDEIAELRIEMTVQGDGSLAATETVVVSDRSGGGFDGGYAMDLRPRACTTVNGSRISADRRIRVKSVDVDGQPATATLSDDVLSVQQKGSPLAEGVRRITLTFATAPLVLDRPQHDELCLVLLGPVRTGTVFRNVSATVRLPPGAHVIFASGEAGLPERQDFHREVEESGEGDIIRYTVTRPLRAGMAFTVDIGFVKGFVRPTWWQRLRLLDRAAWQMGSSLLLALAGFAAVAIYYSSVWHRVGRDPAAPTVSASELSPPAGIDPVAMRASLHRGKTDHRGGAALLLFLAQRGAITIVESRGTYTLERTGHDSSALSERAQAFLAELFREAGAMVLSGRPARRPLARVGRWLKVSLRDEYRRQAEENVRYLWPGIALFIPFFIASLAIVDRSDLAARGDAVFVLASSAVLQVSLFAVLVILWARLLRRPAREYVDLRARLGSYADFLRRTFIALPGRGMLPPHLQVHLPYAMAAGLEVDGLMIRSAEAAWFRGTSGWFVCGDFSRAVQRAWW